MASNYQIPLPGMPVIQSSNIGGKRPTPVVSAQSLRAQAAVQAQFGSSVGRSAAPMSQTGFISGRK